MFSGCTVCEAAAAVVDARGGMAAWRNASCDELALLSLDLLMLSTLPARCSLYRNVMQRELVRPPPPLGGTEGTAACDVTRAGGGATPDRTLFAPV